MRASVLTGLEMTFAGPDERIKVFHRGQSLAAFLECVRYKPAETRYQRKGIFGIAKDLVDSPFSRQTNLTSDENLLPAAMIAFATSEPVPNEDVSVPAQEQLLPIDEPLLTCPSFQWRAPSFKDGSSHWNAQEILVVAVGQWIAPALTNISAVRQAVIVCERFEHIVEDPPEPAQVCQLTFTGAEYLEGKH